MNPLSALPGDEITYEFGEGYKTDIVKAALWQPAPKNGKVWTYETIRGDLVPYSSVKDIKRIVLSSEPTEVFDSSLVVQDEEPIQKVVEKAELATSLKTAIYCVLMDDIKSLEVASFLINQRVKELRELRAARFTDLF